MLLPVALALVGTGPARIPEDPAPLERPVVEVRYYSVKGDPDAAELVEAVESVQGTLLRGPLTAESKPGRAFVAVRVPSGTEARALQRALRRLGKTEELAWTSFEGRDDGDTRLPELGPGFRQRDHILGMSGDLRWFDSAGGATRFYHLPKKLDADEIVDRYHKLFQPFGGGTVGALVRQEVAFDLDAAPDDRTGRKLEKRLAKLDGVTTVELTAARVRLIVALENLVPSGPERPFPGDGAGDDAAPGRGTWSTAGLWEVLDDLELAPAQSPRSR